MIERIPGDVYKRVTLLCKNYYRLIQRQRQIEADIIHESGGVQDGMPRGSSTGDPTAQKAEKIIRLKAENDRRVNAIRAAYDGLYDDAERQIIRKNVFQQIPMDYIDTPVPLRTMKRIRRRFIISCARNLDEWL